MGQDKKSLLITGAGGYIGRQVVEALAEDRPGIGTVVAADIRLPAAAERFDTIEYVESDVRSPELGDILERFKVDVVVHLAAIVSPGRKPNRELEYSVDVLGTGNTLECCLAAGVGKIIVMSSGAAYGYYPDNPEWIDEQDEIRGNPEFAYSDHKRQAENMLAQWRKDHPELKQLIFRSGTILGATTSNQITALFDGRFVMGLSGAATPFVLIWDKDVVGGIIHGMGDDSTGMFNLAGDGTLTMREMAAMMKKPYISVPVGIVKAALWVLKKLRLTQYGPEQVNFLRYRPVLSNKRLKTEFAYIPKKTTRQVFEYFLEARNNAG